MSYGGKSVYRRDMRRVYVLVHGCVCVCASHADELKNGGRLKYMCQQNANLDNKEGLHVFKGYMCSSLAALHVSLTRPRLSLSLADNTVHYISWL